MTAYGGKILAALLFIAVAIWAGLAYLSSRAPAQTPAAEAAPTGILAIAHRAAGGAHMYTGTVEVPACDELSAGIRSTGVNPAHLTLLLTFSPAPCSGSAAAEEFSLSYNAEKGTGAPVVKSVMVNGSPADFAVVEHN